MAFLRPDADVTDGGWTNEAGGTVLFASVNEAAFDDANYIQSSPDPVNDLNRLRLPAPSGSIIEPVTVRYRFHKVGSKSVNQTVRLVQGASTVIAEWIHTDISAAFVTAEQTLTTPQFDLITDFSDLFVETVADTTAAANNTALDGSATSTTTATSIVVTLTTSAPGLICVLATINSGAGVTSITDESTLTWSQLATSSPAANLELWTAVSSGAQTSNDITVNLSANVFVEVIAFGVSGIAAGDPFDGNGVLPFEAQTSPASITTSNANDFLFSGFRNGGNAGPDTGWTQIAAGAGFTLAQYKIVTATQSALSVADPSTSANGALAHAFKST